RRGVCDAGTARSQRLRQLFYRRADGGAGRTRETAFRSRSRRTPGPQRVSGGSQEHVRRPQPPVEARMSPSTLLRAQWLLTWLMPSAYAEALLGDLLEERRLRLDAGSPAGVARWYWIQLASSL